MIKLQATSLEGMWFCIKPVAKLVHQGEFFRPFVNHCNSMLYKRLFCRRLIERTPVRIKFFSRYPIGILYFTILYWNLQKFCLTNNFFGVKLLKMIKIHKKIISGLLPIPFLFVITVCCCLDENVSAAESNSTSSAEHHQELEKIDHSEHQHDSQGEHECACPKHLSFLSAQSADIIFNASLSQLLAKNFMTNLRFENPVLLALLSNHSQGPPLLDHRDYVSLPIYLKISNLRI